VINVYRIGEFAKRVGRSAGTVRRWEREGRIQARRGPSGQRYFDESDVGKVFRPGFDERSCKTVVYCRVSSAGRKDDLASQVTAMERFCLARGLRVDEWLTEIGGGMDLTRRTFVAVMDAIERGEIATLVIAHQDRLARFGVDYLEGVATKNDCEVVVANQQSLSPDQELVHDLVAVVHTFSGRLSGLRRYEKTLKKTLKDELGDGGR
jgi:putative resolvase